MKSVSTLLVILLAFALGPRVAGAGHGDKEDPWHKVLLDYAANHDDSQDPIKQRHQRIAKFCGHDIKVVFDWKTFKKSEWVGRDMGAGYVSDELTAGRNCISILQDLASACENDEARRPKLAKLQTITCVSIPPAKMPNDHGYSSVYKLTKSKTNIEIWEVPFIMSGLPRASDWISQTF
jgi:hypothetical protein